MNHNTRDHNAMSCSTRDRNTMDHSTTDHNNRCVHSANTCHQRNGPSRGYPREYHHTMRSMCDHNDGSDTDDGSGNNPQPHRCNLLRMNRHSTVCCHPEHRWYHVYIRWEHHPGWNHPHNRSDSFRMYNDGYIRPDHGQL